MKEKKITSANERRKQRTKSKEKNEIKTQCARELVTFAKLQSQSHGIFQMKFFSSGDTHLLAHRMLRSKQCDAEREKKEETNNIRFRVEKKKILIN